MIDALGKATGETLYNALRGIDDKKLESDKPRKSVSCEINVSVNLYSWCKVLNCGSIMQYGIRFENNDQAETFIRQMATEIKKRLDAVDMVGRLLTLKIMKRDPTAPVEPPKVGYWALLHISHSLIYSIVSWSWCLRCLQQTNTSSRSRR